jgi:transglutaminase-like putative cysteine protease
MRYYLITHTTIFHYESPVRESVMEVRLYPRDAWHQNWLQFHLLVALLTRVGSYRDWLNNTAHRCDIPATHRREVVTAESVVRLDDLWPIPESLP